MFDESALRSDLLSLMPIEFYMKHIIKKVIGLSLVLLLLVALLPVGVLAAENDTTVEDTTTNDTTTNDTTTEDTTTEDTTTDGAEEAPKQDFLSTFMVYFAEFFAWFTEVINKFFAMM